VNPPTYDVSFGDERGRRIRVVAGSRGIWTFRFVCGDRPIAPGGSVSLFCEVPKFWLGINLQTEDPARDEYAWARASDGVPVELRDIPDFYKKLLWGRVLLPDGLQAGQEVQFGVGTETAPAYAIAHAYHEALVSVRVDYFAEGEDAKVWPPLVISVVPGPAAKLAAVLPSRVTPGEPFRLRVRAEDANSNIGARLDGAGARPCWRYRCEQPTPSQGGGASTGMPTPARGDLRVVLEGPSGACRKLTVSPGEEGTAVVEDLSVNEPGVYRARVESQGLRALSNAMECVPADDAPGRVVWGDLHNHTGFSDGVGTFAGNLEYARDRAFLDVFGFAEHLSAGRDFGTSPVDKGGSDWALLGPEVAALLNRENAPGRFATVLGYEYTPSGRERGPSGDHCVFAPGERWSDLPAFVEQDDLVDLARQAGCLAIPHVGGRTPDWETYRWDPDVTPLAEIASMHEHSEYFVQEALQRGFKVGICGMADGHFGMPGYDCWALHGRTRGLRRRNFSCQSAITAFCIPELTREAAFQAMRRRRVYATTGRRILLDVTVNGRPMGSDLVTDERPVVRIRALGTAPIARVDLIRGDRRVAMWLPDTLDWTVAWTDPAPLAGETYYYVRVTQRDFALAWSSPVWVTYEGSDAATGEAVAHLPRWNGGPEWPEPDPATCDPARSEALRRLLERRGIAERFRDLTPVGVFEENRGRFALFRGTDGADGAPIHLHHYFEFEDGRLYIARGHSDYGQYSNAREWTSGVV